MCGSLQVKISQGQVGKPPLRPLFVFVLVTMMKKRKLSKKEKQKMTMQHAMVARGMHLSLNEYVLFSEADNTLTEEKKRRRQLCGMCHVCRKENGYIEEKENNPALTMATPGRPLKTTAFHMDNSKLTNTKQQQQNGQPCQQHSSHYYISYHGHFSWRVRDCLPVSPEA